MRGLVVLTVQDKRGTVVFHETVRPEEVDSIVARILRSVR